MIRLERTNLDDFQRWLRSVGNNEGWFQRLQGDIPRWMSSQDSHVIAMAIQYLANFRDIHTSFVIENVKPYLDRNQEWNQQIAWMLLYLKNWNVGDEAVELLMHLVRNGDVSLQASLHSLVALANSNVIAGCQLLRLQGELAVKNYLDLKSKQIDQYSAPFPENILKETLDSWEVRGFISVAAQSNPQAILDYLLPWYISAIIELTEEEEQNKSYYPSIWFFNDLDDTPSIQSREGISFTQGLLHSLGVLASTNPTAFRIKVSELAPIEIRIIQQILMRAFRANPTEYVIDIYDFLTGDSRRLHIQPDARHLLGVAYQYSDRSLREKWERFIFSRPQPTTEDGEKSLEKWRQRFRWMQSDILDFLLSIDDSLLSDHARRKKQEIMRLPDFENYEPIDGIKIGTFGAVEAPIPTARQEQLSDDDWLRILRKFDDETDWGKPRKRRHILEGGVVEMSRALQEQVKSNPDRFYRLSKKLDEHISVQYITAIIDGFAHSDSKVPSAWLFDVFRRFHSQITGHSRIGVSKALAVMDPAEVPDDIIDILIMWAKDDPDPDCEEEQQRMREILSKTSFLSDGLINRAINSVRSSAIEDVCRILFQKNPVPLPTIYEIIERGVKDCCASVSTIAIQQLAYWQNISKDHERSIHLFETAIQKHPVLLTSHPIHRYLNWLAFAYPEQAFPYAEVMLEVPHEHTQYMAAQFVCIAGLYDIKEFSELASDLHQNTNPVIRRGAAVIYAQEIGKREKTAICCERLLNLMEDEDEQVRVQSASCFRKLTEEHLRPLQNFFRQFLKTPALQHGGDNFIEYLMRSNLVTPEEQRLSLSLVKDLLEAVSTDLGSYDRGFFRLQREMTLYLRNLYDKTVDHQIREDIMDLFDEMLRLGSDEAQKMLQGEDAEWMPRL